MKKILYILVLLLTLSCNNNTFINNNRLELASSDSLTINNIPSIKKEIVVGDRITNHPLSSQIVEIEGKEKYLLLDLDNIYMFDWNSGMLEDSIHLGTGMLNNYSGFSYISKDSILVYNYKTKKLFLVNQSGDIVHQIETPGIDKKASTYVDIEAINSTRPLYVNKRIILSGSLFGNPQESPDHGERASISCSFENKQSKSSFPFPSIYYKANWGGVYMNNVFHCKDNNSIIYSFPIEHYIYKCNNDFSCCDTIYMGSRYNNGIRECTFSSFQVIYDKDLRVKYYISQPSYGPILYDKEKECYIRIAYHPVNSWDGGDSFFQPFSIIVLDKKKSILMESSIINDYKVCDWGNLHICNDGIAVASLFKSNSEDIICFFCYKY